jgi:small subunit ribosomal protein S17
MIEKKVKKLNNVIKGVVVSDKMDKTIVVAVESFKTHPKYLKKYRSTKKYHVHDAGNKYKVGDRVEFFSTKPISKNKTFMVL